MSAVTLLASFANTSDGVKTATGTPTVERLIVLFVHHSGNTAVVAPTDTNADGLGTYTQIGSNALAAAGGADHIALWVRDALIGSATSTDFTHNPGTTTGGGIAVHEVTAMTRVGAAAYRQWGKSDINGAGQFPTCGFATAPWSTNPLITGIICATNPPAATGPTGWTTRYNDGHAVPTRGGQTCTIDSGENRVYIQWGSTVNSHGSIIVELDATPAANLAWTKA